MQFIFINIGEKKGVKSRNDNNNTCVLNKQTDPLIGKIPPGLV